MDNCLGVDWQTTPGELFKSERFLLKGLAEKVATRFGPYVRIVNIGVGLGASLHCLRAGAPFAELVGVDLDVSQFLGNAGVLLVEGDSGELATQCQVDSEVHLLFIDGGHDDDTVYRDTLGWAGRVVVGGLLAFHDYYEKVLECNFGVRRAVDEWRAQPGWGRRWRWVEKERLTCVFERAYDGL